eukprot:GEMP01020637.1.p1 GENE.GEMP01020637.1~~GEMP01020637.1.p1  ORF type:complete len:567 (+),score=128.01 GEMP01020637.1:211-1911(+)
MTNGTEEKTYTIRELIEVNDDLDSEGYDELPPLSDDGADEEDLDNINKLLIETKVDGLTEEGAEREIVSRAQVSERPAVMDDFIRNFLAKHSMKRTLEAFQAEWYQMKPESEEVPDLYVKTQTMSSEISGLANRTRHAEALTEVARKSWDKFRKERDFHRMHHRRIVQEKEKILVDLKRLKRHYEQYEPTLTELRHKYEVAMKEKTLMRLERDRFMTKAESLQEQLNQAEKKDETAKEDGKVKKEKSTKKADTPWPEERQNPFLNSNFPATKAGEMKLLRTYKGHGAAISSMAFHPKIPVVATVSDDHTWKMWSIPNGELVMSGEGHKNWVSGISFHSKGGLVGTSSGDGTVKIWDMVKESCEHTFAEHSQAVWCCSFHTTSDFLVSGGMDQTAKVWDLQSLRCRQTFRGHVDSVNSVAFQPYGNTICTGSADKTVSLWDLRSGLCVQTFYGHGNACNSVAFNLKGTAIASCDADGICKLWDVRYVSEFLQIDSGHHPANGAAFDRSGKVLAIASGDASVKMFDLEEKAFVVNLDGHEDSVQGVGFDQSGKLLISVSADRTFRIWQ